jgi:hypothetical protein
MSFTNTSQLLPLNKTNLRTLKDALGRDTLKWPGAVVGAYTETTSMGPGVRLNVIRKTKPPSDLNDNIPF